MCKYWDAFGWLPPVSCWRLLIPYNLHSYCPYLPLLFHSQIFWKTGRQFCFHFSSHHSLDIQSQPAHYFYKVINDKLSSESNENFILLEHPVASATFDPIFLLNILASVFLLILRPSILGLFLCPSIKSWFSWGLILSPHLLPLCKLSLWTLVVMYMLMINKPIFSR